MRKLRNRLLVSLRVAMLCVDPKVFYKHSMYRTNVNSRVSDGTMRTVRCMLNSGNSNSYILTKTAKRLGLQVVGYRALYMGCQMLLPKFFRKRSLTTAIKRS